MLDNRVYLKTLGGLKRVDVILRRLDDTFCDPLELRGDSLLGVPGLVQAVRSGSVVIDNALGSGLVETAAHMAFLPGLCRQLLGEELSMPSVATWWCGQESPCRYVLDHMKELVIKPAFPRFGQHPEFPESMDAAAFENLKRRIKGQAEEFVAQERVALSTVPARTEGGLAPRHVVLRVYTTWNGKSYTVLPGGLTRVSTQGASFVVSMHLGGSSKDTWVLGALGTGRIRGRQSSAQVPMQPSAEDLPSRVADNLFWLGRYAERVEARVRFVRALWPALSSEEDFGRSRFAGNRDSDTRGIGISVAGTLADFARRTAVVGSADIDRTGVRPFADVEPALEFKELRRVAMPFERTRFFGYLARAAAARMAIFRFRARERRPALYRRAGPAR